jgi:iron complex outermembrane recepter protein
MVLLRKAINSLGITRPLFRVPAVCVALFATGLKAVPHDFDIPAQPASRALLILAKQAECEVLFSYDELEGANSEPVIGRYETPVALELLLRKTALTIRQSSEHKYVVIAIKPQRGALKGEIQHPDGSPASKINLVLPGTHYATVTDRGGAFTLRNVLPGTYSLLAYADGRRSIQWDDLTVVAGETIELSPQVLQPATDPMQLAPYVVTDAAAKLQTDAQRALIPRSAVGNIDLPRSEDDVLPFRIYEHDQISRSGVVDLNDFLRRELLDSDASTLPPEQDSAQASFLSGSSNLNLRGLGADATIILVNGRRLPESSATTDGKLGAPDVNSIPLSLVEQIEVLPASASALYNGNPVGGVINIVLRPDIDINEITVTYTNAVHGFDAPNSLVSLQHGQTLLDDRLRVRLNATFAQAVPATESELGYRKAHDHAGSIPANTLYRATPNIRSANESPLFGPGSASTTSVAPAADGTAGISAFNGREGMRNPTFYDSAGGFAVSPDSNDNPYGRRQKRQSYFLSAEYDLFPWLQLGFDSIYTQTVVNRGYDVFRGDLQMAATSPLNPFNQDILISLNETAAQLGENYSEARLELLSTLVGALIKFPADWKLSLDAQYARNIARYRGFAGADPNRWQQLVDQGLYNPLRDTQTFGPPREFYDRVLVHYGHKDRFVTVGDYNTLDTAIRLTNQKLPLPTGISTLALGFDYRRTELEDYKEELTYADGTLADAPVFWDGRTLERLSVFGELQAPLIPSKRLPSWLESIEGVLAARYIAADTSRETNLAPTFGLKVDLAGGLAVRGSATISNRFPISAMSNRVDTSNGSGPGINYAFVYDPQRNQSYDVQRKEDLNPDIVPEGAVTQSIGLLFRRGDIHRFRASLDFVDTTKENELLFLEPQTILNLESLWPERVERAPLAPGDSKPAGSVESVLTGLINVSSRHSQNWNGSLDYTWMNFLGGRLDAGTRLVVFQKYERQVLPTSPVVDELASPDGTASGLMKYRAKWNVSWIGHRYGFGADGHYYHSRILPAPERPGQGSDRIARYWQYDIFVQTNLAHSIPWLSSLDQMTAQLRVNNLFNSPFPEYANDASGAGVQAYGDWRGRTFSLSLTTTF